MAGIARRDEPAQGIPGAGDHRMIKLAFAMTINKKQIHLRIGLGEGRSGSNRSYTEPRLPPALLAGPPLSQRSATSYPIRRLRPFNTVGGLSQRHSDRTTLGRPSENQPVRETLRSGQAHPDQDTESVGTRSSVGGLSLGASETPVTVQS
eukprot:763560-Hanusia_phi.AAC.1